jgi:hypothetical protein
VVGSHAALYGKGRQNQDEGIDDAPRKGDPCRHAKVASSIDTTQETTNDIASNQGFDGTNCTEDDGSNPDELPVAPLDGHSKSGSNQVDADNINDGPEQGEAPYVV